VKELGLAYMKNIKRPHAGFPEMAYRKYADQLVRLGYRVGRVEQTETPAELKEANARGVKRKVVNRSMCSILTPGTLTDPDSIGNFSHPTLSYWCMQSIADVL
jgi:DNA mismatch repair protein MSH6